MTTPREALQRLRDGNRRFVTGASIVDAAADRHRVTELAAGQSPLAAVLGCSDSRVAPERVFDQRLGDLFVVRVAGSVAGPSEVGSIGFAVEHLGVRLVVVVGHNRYGAVTAAVAARRECEQPPSGRLRPLLELLWPAADQVIGRDPGLDHEVAVDRALRAHVRGTADRLRDACGEIGGADGAEELLVVGATYDLGSGAVAFFDAPQVE